MKNIIKTSSVAFLLSVSTLSFAQTADIKTSVKSCSGSDYTATEKRKSVPYADRIYWEGFNTETAFSRSTQTTRKNLSDDLCKEDDINEWMTSLKNQCATYFNVVSFTPLTKGYSEYIWVNDTSNTDDHSGGMGYSYTDRLVLVYHCL